MAKEGSDETRILLKVGLFRKPRGSASWGGYVKTPTAAPSAGRPTWGDLHLRSVEEGVQVGIKCTSSSDEF